MVEGGGVGVVTPPVVIDEGGGKCLNANSTNLTQKSSIQARGQHFGGFSMYFKHDAGRKVERKAETVGKMKLEFGCISRGDVWAAACKTADWCVRRRGGGCGTKRSAGGQSGYYWAVVVVEEEEEEVVVVEEEEEEKEEEEEDWTRASGDGTGSVWRLRGKGGGGAMESMDMGNLLVVVLLLLLLLLLLVMVVVKIIGAHMLVAWNQHASRAISWAAPARGPSITTVCRGRLILRHGKV
jgi:hypothetical protein